MSTETISLDVLMRNVDELYALANALDCKTDVPASEMKQMIGAFVPSVGMNVPGMIVHPGSVWIAIGMSLFGKAVKNRLNAAAQKKAREKLVPLYKEMAVKIQAERLARQENERELVRRIQEEKQKNINNERDIAALKRTIQKQNEIITRFEALTAAG